MITLKTTPILTWYKKANKLAEKIIINNLRLSVDITFMNLADDHQSVTIYVHDDSNRIPFHESICNYLDEKENRNTYKKFERFVNGVIDGSIEIVEKKKLNMDLLEEL